MSAFNESRYAADREPRFFWTGRRPADDRRGALKGPTSDFFSATTLYAV